MIKKGNKDVTWFLFALCIILSFLTGLSLGTNIFIPDNIDIGLDEETQLNLETFPERMEQAFKENKAVCNITMDEQMYIWILTEHQNYINRIKQESVIRIDTFCKKPDTIGKLHLDTPRDLVLLELNKPVELYGKIFEIVSANGYDSSIILDIQGSRKTFVEGDCYGDGKITICAESIFISDIPTLDAMGEFIIEEN